MIMGYMTGDFYKAFTKVTNGKPKNTPPRTARNKRRIAKKRKQKEAA